MLPPTRPPGNIDRPAAQISLLFVRCEVAEFYKLRSPAEA